MSGGYFDYNQYKMHDIDTELDDLIANSTGYSQKTIDEFRTGQILLKKAAVYVQRIDWLVSSDDSEESFHRRLKQELDTIGQEHMSVIDGIIFALFTERWFGESVIKDLGSMRKQLFKNLQDQVKGYWSGATAYGIMIDGGFLIDTKPSKSKKLTLLGHLFMKDFESKNSLSGTGGE